MWCQEFRRIWRLRLWNVKIRAVLILYGCERVIDKFPDGTAKEAKYIDLTTETYKKAHSTILICVANRVPQEVAKETSAGAVLLTLELLYMTNSLAMRLKLKKKLYTSYMGYGKKISEHMDGFNKLINDLAILISRLRMRIRRLITHIITTIAWELCENIVIWAGSSDAERCLVYS